MSLDVPKRTTSEVGRLHITNIVFITVIDFIIFVMCIDGDNSGHDIFSAPFRLLTPILVGSVGRDLSHGAGQQSL